MQPILKKVTFNDVAEYKEEGLEPRLIAVKIEQTYKNTISQEDLKSLSTERIITSDRDFLKPQETAAQKKIREKLKIACQQWFIPIWKEFYKEKGVRLLLDHQITRYLAEQKAQGYDIELRLDVAFEELTKEVLKQIFNPQAFDSEAQFKQIPEKLKQHLSLWNEEPAKCLLTAELETIFLFIDCFFKNAEIRSSLFNQGEVKEDSFRHAKIINRLFMKAKGESDVYAYAFEAINFKKDSLQCYVEGAKAQTRAFFLNYPTKEVEPEVFIRLGFSVE